MALLILYFYSSVKCIQCFFICSDQSNVKTQFLRKRCLVGKLYICEAFFFFLFFPLSGISKAFSGNCMYVRFIPHYLHIELYKIITDLYGHTWTYISGCFWRCLKIREIRIGTEYSLSYRGSLIDINLTFMQSSQRRLIHQLSLLNLEETEITGPLKTR